jgi:predicted RND superfamily exporter protein
VESPVKRVLVWSIHRPAAAAILFGLITLALAWQLPRLEIDASNEGLMLERDPARQYYEQAKATFGSDDLTVVLVKGDIFTAPVLALMQRLSEALEQIDGVMRVDSLATVDNISAADDGMEISPLLHDGIPADAAGLARLKAKALANPVFVKNLVSADAHAAGILVFTQPAAADKGFNSRFSAAVDAVLARESVSGVTTYQIGGPLLKHTFVEYVEGDQTTLVPLSVVTLFIVLMIGFRTPQGVVGPLFTGVSSVLWGVGLMALFHIPMNVVTVAVPSLVLVVGFAEAVHIISAYHACLRAGRDKIHALSDAVEDAAAPILVTTATTVLGFATLIFSDITILKQFGWAATLGLTANFAATLLGIPMLLRLWPTPKRIRASAVEESAAGATLEARITVACDYILRHRLAISAVFAALAIGSLWGWSTLKVDTDFVSYFPKSAPVRQRMLDVDRSLAGASAFFVVMETGRENGVADPATLKQIASLQQFIESLPGISKTVSIVDYVSQLNASFVGTNAGPRSVPDSADVVSQQLLLMDRAQTARFIDLSASSANIVVRHSLTGSWELGQALRQIDRYVAQNIHGVQVHPTGQSILTNRAADYMAVNEVTSFAWTLAIIGIIHSLLFMSVKAGFLSLIPNVTPVIYSFGLMGLLGIPLSTGTALVATIAIGIAVDDTVHNMMTYSRQLNEHRDERTAVLHTLFIQFRPIVFVSTALACGFIVLVFSRFVPTVQLAFLSAFVMIVAMISELVLSPILLASTRLVTAWDLMLIRMNPDLVKRAPLFEGLSRWEARKVVVTGMLRSLGPGEYAIRRGDQGRQLYMVVSGRLLVVDSDLDGHERTLAIVDAGGVFGETGMVADGYRTFSARAESPAEILQLDFDSLERLRKRFPFTAAKVFRNLARILGERLQDTTTAMMFLSSPGAASDLDTMPPHL